jgi:sulfotransferase family protein
MGHRPSITVTRRPDFFIVGAPKSGTTAMYEYLRGHPELFLPSTKEYRFFGTDLDIRDRPERKLEDFLALFDGAGSATRVGSAYVWYLYSKTAAAEIHAFSPRAQIVVMLRCPADMLYSLHSEHLSNGNEDLSTFEDALAAEPARHAGQRIPRRAHLPQGLFYSEVARYAEQLERYFRVFGRERVHVMIYDDFARDTEGSYRDTLSFLGVSQRFVPQFPVVNPNKRVRSEAVRHFLARPPELPRRIIRAAVPKLIRRAAYERAQRLNTSLHARPDLSEATRERVNDLYRTEVELLSQLLRRDLAYWLERDAGGRFRELVRPTQ